MDKGHRALEHVLGAYPAPQTASTPTPEQTMSHTIPKHASDVLAQEAEQLDEYLVDQLGYATYDVDVRVTDDGRLDITVEAGVAAPETWPDAVQEEYCRRSKRERRRLDERLGLPTRIREELEQALEK